MREYFLSVIAVSLLSALLGFLTYGGACERAVRAAAGVILIYTVCMPLGDFLADFSPGELSVDVSAEVEVGSSEFFEVAKDSFEKGVKNYVSEQFRLASDEVYVSAAGFDYEKMTAERIFVVLSGRAALADCARIRQTVEDAGLGECEVNIKID